jgi:hypothetical protein
MLLDLVDARDDNLAKLRERAHNLSGCPLVLACEYYYFVSFLYVHGSVD